MKLALVKVAIVEAASAAALETAVNAVLAVGGQKTYVDIKLVVGANYLALISYTD